MQLVSVVVITYNSEKTIIDTLESIRKQTYQMLELVISDDCSKDNTIKVVNTWLEKYKERFQNIEVIEIKKNTGVAANSNRGIRTAKGKYIELVAGDDLLFDIAIEEKYKFAEEKQLPLVINKVKPFGKSAVRTHIAQQELEEAYQTLKLDRREQLRKNLLKNCIPGTMVSFYSKDFFWELGGYDETYPMIEDWSFSIEILRKSVPLIMLDKELCYYRVSTTSLSNSTNNPLLRKSVRKIILRKNIWLLIKNGWIKEVFSLLASFYFK